VAAAPPGAPAGRRCPPRRLRSKTLRVVLDDDDARVGFGAVSISCRPRTTWEISRSTNQPNGNNLYLPTNQRNNNRSCRPGGSYDEARPASLPQTNSRAGSLGDGGEQQLGRAMEEGEN
jgi:hypothetical protein